MRIAIVGAGAAGLTAALCLSSKHSVCLFEKEAQLGGHAHTTTVAVGNQTFAIDTGFIVYNNKNYPNLTALFRYLKVETNKTNMNFSVYGDVQFEWSSESLKTIFSSLRNLSHPSFFYLLHEILRFNRVARKDLNEDKIVNISLGSYLQLHKFGKLFKENYLLPMASAIWSSSPAQILEFPAQSFVTFFDNHRLLHRRRPPWRTVKGGSIQYVKRIADRISGSIQRSNAVQSIVRTPQGVVLSTSRGGEQEFDAVVLACHADTALSLLKDASDKERNLLRSFKFRENRVVLHSDELLMPKQRSHWTSWNCRVDAERENEEVSITYYMNKLQAIDSRVPFFVTLNPTMDPRSDLVHEEFLYSHPQFDEDAIFAQTKLKEIQGTQRTWFAGAYSRNGFHEDAVSSGIAVAQAFDCSPPWISSSS